ncbi:MAG: 2-oxoglutarate dehydrogenase E1 component [Bradymonadales bacterium]|nr:MAG: 2-oxoglutarate dehydrogenase E1 component [Bradymonadales bacterium]
MSAKPTGDLSPADRIAFLHQFSPEYLDYLREQYRQDPDSVAADLAFFFDAYDMGRESVDSGLAPISVSSEVADEIRVKELIEAYRMRGHLIAHLDPLGLWKSPLDPHLDLAYFNLQNVPKDRNFQAASEIGLPASPITKIVERLKESYSHFVGVEYHYIRNEEVRNWLQTKIEENQNHGSFDPEEKLRILKHLFRASIFENFLQSNYTGQKRFSLEGSESLIPALKHAISVCADLGAHEIVIGMAHRGRLNVLTNVLEKPYQEIFKEFEGAELPDMAEAMGDVKYHQGYSADEVTPNGKKLHLSLAPNPSHLEWVNPVVEGVARAKQDTKHQGNRNAVVPILIHGDAAIIGQGVVAETLNLAQLNGYHTGGTIHIVINNQIGFTTLPPASRSSLYCTDFGKAFQAPIFHVNGDQVEDVVHCIKLATEFRMKFNKDVFVDIWCYRKYGHNEGDEPRFTQPLMYKVIQEHPSPLEIYAKKLTDDHSVEQEQVDQFIDGFKEELDRKREEIKNVARKLNADMFGGLWEGFERSDEKQMLSLVQTGISEETFSRVIDAIHHIPSELKPLPKFEKLLKARKKRILEKDEIDWSTGEQLAFGSLLLEGIPVRLSGQDSIRGTFSQRHLAMRDHESGKRYYFLQHLDAKQASLYCYDSPLSEAAVLGFDYGYSVAQPKALVLWEGQFGDFVNTAQVIIDQFIVSAEAKWYRMSGLVMLLPHGYEGQGPEHSSARLERFLQLCAQNNIQVCYPTTPAQYAHLLTRQIHRRFRKPLVIMTPKSPLRMPEVVSKKSDFLDSGFQSLLFDQASSPERILLCSGKIYWDLLRGLKERSLEDRISIVRVEQLYPLDKTAIKSYLEEHPSADRVWVQEEPKNMGAWSHICLEMLEQGISLRYLGRPAAASPATGSFLKHEREQRQLVEDSLDLSHHGK